MASDNMAKEDSGSTAQDRVSIPEKQPEVEKSPAYKIDWPNYADVEGTDLNAVSWVTNFYNAFEDQDAWQKFMDNMDSADEMMRAAVNRVELTTQESDNTEDTRSKIKSAAYHSDLTVINAGETAVMLDKDNQLPVIYEPLPDSEEYSVELGEMLAEERNAVLAYTMEKSNMRDDMGSARFALPTQSPSWLTARPPEEISSTR